MENCHRMTKLTYEILDELHYTVKMMFLAIFLTTSRRKVEWKVAPINPIIGFHR
jgi:hypothetical protein